MVKRIVKVWFSAGLIVFISSLSLGAAEKVKFGTSVRVNPLYVLPILIAEEKGFWKEQGLEVDYIPFRGGTEMHRAVAGGSLDMAITSSTSIVQAIARGLPEIIVADLGSREDFFVWVRADSRIREPKDLKGAKIGINRFGGLVHSFGLVVAKSLGLEKEITFVAGGDALEELAMIKGGTLDGRVGPIFTLAPLMYKGEVRQVVAVRPYLPEEWPDLLVFARRDVAEGRPEATRKTTRGVLAGASAVLAEQAWSLAKMKSAFAYDEGLAKLIFSHLYYRKDGKIDKKGIENVRNFLVQYGIIPKGKEPAVEKLFTNRFVE